MVRDGTYSREGDPSSKKKEIVSFFRLPASGRENEGLQAVLQILFIELSADEDEAGAGEAFGRPAPADFVADDVEVERFIREDDLALGAVHVLGQVREEGVEALPVHFPVGFEDDFGKFMVVVVMLMPMFMIVLMLVFMFMLFFAAGVFGRGPVRLGRKRRQRRRA